MGRPTRRTTSAVALAATAALALLHALLLWGRLADGTLLKPAVALRWASAIALLATLWALRRRRIPLFRGRRALVLWCLVALLHATAAPGALAEPGHGAGPAPDAPSLVPVGLTLAAALLAAALPGAAPSPASANPARSPGWGRPSERPHTTALLGCSYPRPPPPPHTTRAPAG